MQDSAEYAMRATCQTHVKEMLMKHTKFDNKMMI